MVTPRHSPSREGRNDYQGATLRVDGIVWSAPKIKVQSVAEMTAPPRESGSNKTDGTTEPLGLRTTGATQGDIADVLMASATAVVADDLLNIYSTLPAQWRGNATWHMTSAMLFRQIAAIQITGAGLHFIEDIRDGPGQRLLGKPAVLFDGTGWDDAAAIAASEEVGAFGDFSLYYFIDRIGMSITRLDERYADTDQVGFKARKRYDSFFAENDAFRIIKGAAS